MMQLWCYGSIMMLLVFYSNFPNGNINPTNLTSTTMSFTKEQITVIKDANIQLETLEQYCQENNVDLEGLLSEEEQQDMQAAMGVLDELLPRVEEEITKKDFAIELEDWAYDEAASLRLLLKDDTLLKKDEIITALEGLLRPNYKLKTLLKDDLILVVQGVTTPTRGAMAKALEDHLVTYTRDKAKSIFTGRPDIKKDLKDLKSIKNTVLPDKGELFNILDSDEVEDVISDEEVARTWLKGELGNLQKMTFADGISIYCDTFRTALTTSIGRPMQSLLCDKIPSKEENALKIQQIIVGNIQRFLNEKELNDVFINHAPEIKGYSSYKIVLALDGHLNAPKLNQAIQDSVALFRNGLELTDTSYAKMFVKPSTFRKALSDLVKNEKLATPYVLSKILTIKDLDSKITIGEVVDQIDANAQNLVGDSKMFLACSDGTVNLPIPTQLIRAIETSKANISLDILIESVDKWTERVGAIFQDRSKHWRFDSKKLHKQLEALFVEEAAFIYSDFLAPMIDNTSLDIIPLNNKVPNEDLPTDFAEIWKQTLAGIDSSYLVGVYEELTDKTNDTTIENLEALLSILDIKWPDNKMLWTALGSARHFSKKVKIPTTNKELYAKILLTPKDTEIKGRLGVIMRMPMEYKPFTVGGDEQLMFFPIVVENNIGIEQDNTGRLNYSNAKAKVCQIEASDSFKMVTYKVVLKILIKDDQLTAKAETLDITEAHITSGWTGGGEVKIFGQKINTNVDVQYTEEHATRGKSTEIIEGTGYNSTMNITLYIKAEEKNEEKLDIVCYSIGIEDEHGGSRNDFGFNLSCKQINEYLEVDAH